MKVAFFEPLPDGGHFAARLVEGDVPAILVAASGFPSDWVPCQVPDTTVGMVDIPAFDTLTPLSFLHPVD